MSVNEVRNPVAKNQFEIRGGGGASTFCVGDEDHTLANALRHVLINAASEVEFAGYSVPHPSEAVVQIRVQTIRKPEGRKSALHALQEACNTLSEQCQFVIDQLEGVLPETKEDRIKNEQRLLDEARRDAEDEEEEEDIMEDDDD